MKEGLGKINLRQLTGDFLTIVLVGFLMFASLIAFEYWFSGEAKSDFGNNKIFKILEISNRR